MTEQKASNKIVYLLFDNSEEAHFPSPENLGIFSSVDAALDWARVKYGGDTVKVRVNNNFQETEESTLEDFEGYYGLEINRYFIDKPSSEEDNFIDIPEKDKVIIDRIVTLDVLEKKVVKKKCKKLTN